MNGKVFRYRLLLTVIAVINWSDEYYNLTSTKLYIDSLAITHAVRLSYTHPINSCIFSLQFVRNVSKFTIYIITVFNILCVFTRELHDLKSVLSLSPQECISENRSSYLRTRKHTNSNKGNTHNSSYNKFFVDFLMKVSCQATIKLTN